MATNVGSYTISDLLAAKHQSLKSFGMDTVAQVLQADLSAHNAMVSEMVRELCDVTTDAQRIYGASSVGEMQEVDEFGLAQTQMVPAGDTVGFPLKKFQYGTGWTWEFLQEATPADLAKKQLDAEVAHLKAIQTELKKAIFKKTNFTFRDYLVDNVTVAVKRFANADGMNIPDGPNGETFAGATHLHYQSTGTPTVADYTAIISNVVEHGHGGNVRLYINRAQEATVSAYTGFHALQPVYLTNFLASGGIAVGNLDMSRLDNRQIGYLGAAEVWTKPWVPASYVLVFDAADARKPLAFRQKRTETLQGLRMAAELDAYPLQAKFYEAEYGVGVWTRTNGAVLYVGNDTWADGI